jgi:pilus assembly protein CpaE
MIHVALISSSGAQLNEVLRACGAKVSTVAEGASSLPSPPPDVVVFDLRERTAIPSAIPLLRRLHADLGIVIVAPALDTNLLLEAVRAGVNEVVVDPVSQAEMEKALARVIGQRGSETGQVFGFIGAKGGVGTTTVAVNTATALGALSKPGRTLLIDLHHAGGDAALFLGVEPRFSTADVLQNTHRLDRNLFRGFVTEVAPNTDFLASPEDTSATRDAARIRAVVEFTRNIYRYVVLDLSRTDTMAPQALDAINAMYIVANQELGALKSGRRLAESLRQHYGRDKVKMVVSRPDRQADIQDSDIARVTGCSVSHSFPSDYRRALTALNKGRPITFDNHNDLSASFKKFAHRLAGVAPERPAAPRGGLLGRLTERRTP